MTYFPRVAIHDPDETGVHARVLDTPEYAAQALHVLNPADILSAEAFKELLSEIRVLNKHMELITGANFTVDDV